MKRRHDRPIRSVPDPADAALVRARAARRRGKGRGEINALRLACSLREYDAAVWTLLGAALLRVQNTDEAVGAFRHALWLRERSGDEDRVRTTRRLIDSALR